MGGLQGWHLVILMLIAVVVIAIVVVIKAASRPKVGAGAGAERNAVPTQGASAQIGYTMNGQPMYQQPVVPRTNLFAILALVLGLFTGVLGIVFGHIARSQISRTGEGGSGLALAGLVIGYAWLGLILLRVVV